MRLWILSVGLLLVVGIVGCVRQSPVRQSREEEVATEINRLGGSFSHASGGVAGPIVEVYFNGTHLTDVGLEHLKGLNNLRQLHLGSTQVTDAGLEHLKGLTKLSMLWLSHTQITDGGLEHLSGMTNLRHLFVDGTQVTDEGVKKLEETLPECGVTTKIQGGIFQRG